MFLMDYTKERDWHNPRIEPYHSLRLDPMAMVFHYNQEVFEGMKAYHCDDGSIAMFRPEKNIERLNASAKRMVMPEIDPNFVLNAMKKLILIDREWIPKSTDTSLYIRPTMIATEPALGVRPANQYLFYILLSPVGAYYPGGFNPTKILISNEYSRASKGGIGEAKTSCNYGGTLLAFQEAVRKGFNQVLWLDAKEKEYVEEVGTSNIFLVFQDELATPSLNGTILPGITRDTVIRLAKHWSLKVSERLIAIDEVIEGGRNGKLKEMFASGTAAVISPIGEITYKGEEFKIADGKVGKVAARLYDEITAIQCGWKQDLFGWHQSIAG